MEHQEDATGAESCVYAINGAPLMEAERDVVEAEDVFKGTKRPLEEVTASHSLLVDDMLKEVNSSHGHHGHSCEPPLKKPTPPQHDNGELSRLERIKRQVEYYFCDNSMQHDVFLQEKIKKTAELEGVEEGWLEIRWLLGAPRLRQVKTTQEDILLALKLSHLELKTDSEGRGWIRRLQPLPPLTPKPSGRRGDTDKTNGCKTSHRDPHMAGCLVKIDGIPEEVTSWQTVRSAMKEKLPEQAANAIRFVSKVDQGGRCFLWCRTFEGDRGFFSDCEFDVGGAIVKCSLMDDEEEIRRLVNELFPPRVQSDRKKELSKLRNILAAKPLLVGGQEFNNMEHLRKCLKELLEKTDVGVQFDAGTSADAVLRAILMFHPNSSFKTGGPGGELLGVKVGVHENKDRRTGEHAKCFYSIAKRQSGEVIEQDFSVLKCLHQLSLNPSIVAAPKINEEQIGNSSGAQMEAKGDGHCNVEVYHANGKCGDEDKTNGKCGDEDKADATCGDENKGDETREGEYKTNGKCGNEDKTNGKCGDEDKADETCGDEDKGDETREGEDKTNGKCGDEDMSNEKCEDEVKSDGKCADEDKSNEKCGDEDKADETCGYEDKAIERCGYEDKSNGKCADEDIADEKCGDEDKSNGKCADEDKADESYGDEDKSVEKCE